MVDAQPDPPPSAYTSSSLTRALAILICLATLPCLAIYVTVRPAMQRRLLDQVTQGMTKREVRAILGRPQVAEERQQWVYSRWGNAGWVEIHFNVDETVLEVNDESAFPRAFAQQ